jgi:excisionase family DNA binding protein
MDLHEHASVSPREAAQMLGIRLDAVYGLIWAGRLQAEKQDGRWLVSQSAVEARVWNNARRKVHCKAPEHIEQAKGETSGGGLR